MYLELNSYFVIRDNQGGKQIRHSSHHLDTIVEAAHGLTPFARLARGMSSKIHEKKLNPQ